MKIKTIASSSSGCCYVIESGGEQLLIECGVPLKKIREALNFDLSKVVGCLISHEHKDHCKSIRDIVSKTTIHVYAPNRLVSGFCGHNCSTVNDNKISFTCGSNFRVMPILLPHDVECFGYVIGAGDSILFYATDTGEVNYTIPGLTHLLIEANYSPDALFESELNGTVLGRISENHLGIEQAIDFAARHKKTLKEVHLTHLSDRHSDEKQFKRMAQEILGIPIYIAQK